MAGIQGLLSTALNPGATFNTAPGNATTPGAAYPLNQFTNAQVNGLNNTKNQVQQTPQQTPQVDPYAQYGGQAAYNNLQSGFANQKSNIYGTANDAASQLQGGYAQSINDIIYNLTQGQKGIDRQATNNESSRIQATNGILGMVGQGIKSGGVYLSGRNAGNSSATQAIADAYGKMGRQQMSTVGNQFAQQQGDLALKQEAQDYQVSQAPNKFHLQLTQDVNNIVNQARDRFGQLDAAMASASLPDRIAIEQEKEAVRQQVLGKLQQYDAQLQTGVSGIKAQGADQIRTAAQSQIQAGTADPNMFNFSTEAPMQVQNSGPVASNLPLFTMNKKQQQLG